MTQETHRGNGDSMTNYATLLQANRRLTCPGPVFRCISTLAGTHFLRFQHSILMDCDASIDLLYRHTCTDRRFNPSANVICRTRHLHHTYGFAHDTNKLTAHVISTCSNAYRTRLQTLSPLFYCSRLM